MLPFHLPYFRPFKERFWESYIYNGKGGEWGGVPSFSVQLGSPFPWTLSQHPLLQICLLQIPCSLSSWRWLVKESPPLRLEEPLLWRRSPVFRKKEFRGRGVTAPGPMRRQAQRR